MRAEVVPSELLEREADRARIAEALARARGGRGALLLLEGPAGVGKTALLGDARGVAEAAGMRVLRARGAELEREFAFGVVRQLLEPALRGAGDPGLLEGPAGVAARLLALPGATGDIASGFADQDASFALLHGLYWLCANLAARGPLVLSVDDAHLADAPSLRFLTFLAPRLEELPMAVLVAARPDPAPPLLEALASDPAAEPLVPAPLSRAAVAELLAAGLAAEPDPAFADACHRATGGLPFLVSQVVARLLEDGIAPDAATAPLVPALGGRVVGRWMVARLARLPPAAGRLARALAILESAELAQAAALAGLEPAEAGPAADALVAAGVLGAERPLAFAHPMLREALSAELAPADRAGGHREAARVLHDAGEPAERVAEHLLLAVPAGDGWVVEVLSEAARQAAGRGAPASAAVHLRRALAEPPPGDAFPLLLRCGLAEADAGDPGWDEHLRAAAAAAPDGATRAAVAVTTAQALLREERAEEALEALDDAAAEAGGGALGPQLEAMAAVAGSLDARLRPATVTRSESVRAAAEDPAAPREVLAIGAWEATYANEPAAAGVELAWRAFRASPRAIPAASDLPSTWFTLAVLVLIYGEDYPGAAELLDTAVLEFRAAGAGANLATALSARAWLSLRRGDLRAAEVDARTVVEAAGLPLPLTYRLICTAILGATLVERGDPEGAERAIAPAEPWATEPAPPSATVRLARGRLRLAQGRAREALADLVAAGEVVGACGVRSPGIFPWRADAVAAHLMLGERDAALALSAEELALARAFGAPRALGIALRARGLAEGGRGGEALLREAVAVLDGADARVEHIRARTDLGAHLRRANRRREARELLRSALDAAHRAGAGALAARAEAELRATGARPRSVVVSGLESLTASERRVAELARDGMTNREIAQTLFVTARTVEGHLTQVFRKLDVAGREGLSSALAA